MKKILFATTLILVILGGSMYASFPVKSNKQTTVTDESRTVEEVEKRVVIIDQKVIEIPEQAEIAAEDDSLSEDEWITLALWAFLWPFAAHRWYKGKPIGWNILFILTAGGCGVWAIIDLINILKGDF